MLNLAFSDHYNNAWLTCISTGKLGLSPHERPVRSRPLGVYQTTSPAATK
jgi:hypothetical protein